MSSAEPDQDVTPALGAALAEPYDTLVLSRDEWNALVAVLRQVSRALGLEDPPRVAADAAVAEKNRIAQVAEDLAAHYHGADGQSALFADFLRTRQAIKEELA